MFPPGGEVRGAEALDMLQAMNTGHEGSLTTIHANSTRDALHRLGTMVAMANLNLPHKAARQQIASAITVIIQALRLTDGQAAPTGYSKSDTVTTVSLLAGFALTGWAFCLLAYRWTGKWSAGYVAGSLAAFNAHSLVQFTHMQFLHPEFIALMLFALDRLMQTRRTRDAVMLGVGFALQGLTSVYMLVFAAWTMIFAVVSRI